MNKWNKRFIKILISIIIIASIILLAMRILGKQNRTAYLTNFNLNIDKTLELNNLEYLKTNFIIEDKIENKLADKNNYLLTNNITNYSYRFMIRYYDKVFRNSDIYGVYPNLSNLPDYIKEIKMDRGGSPYGSLISDKIIDYEEKIDNINYILEIKGKIFIVLYILIIVLLFCFALNFHNKYKAFMGINKYKKIMVFAIFSILAIFLISIIILKLNNLIFEPLFYLTLIFIIISALTLFLYLKFNSFSMKYDVPCVYLLSICVFFIMFYAHELYKFEFGKSFLYGYGDMMQFLTVIAGVIREPIFPIPTDNLGYPFGGYIGTYSMFLLMNFEILKMKILSIFTKDPIDLFNYAYLSIPFITAIISFYVMRNLKLSRFMSIFGSLIFPFMIYYFRRHFEHYNYSAIYFIPLTVLLCIWLFKYDDLLMPNKNLFKTFKTFKIFKNKRNIIAIIFTLLIANNGGGYYQFFSCFLICASALSKFLKVKKLKALIPYAITVSIILLFFIINLAPYFIYKTNHNISAKVIRGFQASEEFGLKISHLFLNPRLFSDYYERAVLFNENSDAYLGIVGILGFVGLLLYLFFKDNYDRKNDLNILSDLNIMSVLYATVGGFSALFSFFISDIIRAPTRISIYIAYICILAFCIFMDKLKNKNIYFYIVMSFLLIFTLFEQTYRNPKRLELYDRHFYADISLLKSDRNLIETIERIMPKNSAIYQLPTYSLSPLDETIKVNGFLSYKLCVGYVFSKNLKWSFGIDFGRKENEWFDKVSEMDTFNMLNEISYAGFNGILIDKDYFADKDYIENLSKNISFILNQEPLISEKGNLVFFSLIDFKENKKENKLDKNYKPLINNYLSKSVGGGKMKLSVIIPCYNEENTIEIIVDAVINSKCSIEKEIIIVDDCSKDNTRDKLKEIEYKGLKIIYHEKNMGKGAALRTGIKAASGDFVIIQDADLEYDPNEYDKLLQPLINNKADVVFGSRFAGGESHRVLYFWHQMGNSFLTLCSNMFTNINLTDMETCYKIFRREIIQSIKIEENRFGFEPEITAKISKIKDIRIYEVGISYNGRTYKEGKKIGLKDGFRALYCILKYNLF